MNTVFEDEYISDVVVIASNHSLVHPAYVLSKCTEIARWQASTCPVSSPERDKKHHQIKHL